MHNSGSGCEYTFPDSGIRYGRLADPHCSEASVVVLQLFAVTGAGVCVCVVLGLGCWHGCLSRTTITTTTTLLYRMRCSRRLCGVRVWVRGDLVPRACVALGWAWADLAQMGQGASGRGETQGRQRPTTLHVATKATRDCFSGRFSSPSHISVHFCALFCAHHADGLSPFVLHRELPLLPSPPSPRPRRPPQPRHGQQRRPTPPSTPVLICESCTPTRVRPRCLARFP